MATRGISIVDLLGLPPGSAALVPADIRAELAKLAVIDFTVITSDDAFIYAGTIRSLGEAFFASSLNWPIELPLLNAGVPFQLVRRRLPLVGDIEPAPDGFQLDLLLNRVAIAIPGLQPAVAIPGAGVTAAHLIRPIAGQPLFGKRVKIVGSGTLRIASAPGGGAPVIRFVAPPDPFDPAAPTGALVGLTFEPASFFLGSSDYGLTVEQLLYDDSEAFTPADIEGRGQGPEWRGISIREATLYFPRNAPAVGDLSVGVRDVLLGSPLGLQGEVRIEFGTTPVNPATISVTQHQVGTPPADVALGSPVAGAQPRTFQVQLSGLAGTRALVSARGPDGSTNRWTLPDRTMIIDSTTGQFAVEAGDTLRVAGVEGGAADLAISPEVTILFVPQAAAVLPAITVTVGGELRTGVLSLSGTPAILSGIAYTLDPATDTAFEWQFGEGVTAQTARGASFTPVIPATPGLYFLSVGKPDGTPQRVRIEVLAEGALLIGCRAGLFDISAPVGVRAIEGTYRLPSFNRRGDMDPAPGNATLAAGVVSVAAGELASVTADWGGGGAAPPPPPDTLAAASRHVQVLMQFDHTTPIGWVPDPDNGSAVEAIATETEARAKLAEWTAKWNGATYIVVGRTCDIGTPARNQALSAARGAAGKALLGGVTAFQRGERFNWGEAGTDAGAATEAASTIPADERAKAATDANAAPDYDGWLFKIASGGGFPSDPSTTAHDRPLYRRADFYAVGGTPIADPAAPPDTASQAATTLRRALVPGTLPPTLVPLAPRDVATPYRVRLVVRWDSPTVTELSDAIPTQAELTIAWQGRSIPVPGGVGNVTPTATRPQQVDGHEVFTLIGGWTYDPRTTATQFSLALNSTGDPDGLAMLTGDSAPMNAVATAFALGPALLAGIGAGDVAGGVTRVAALVAAIGFAAAFGKDGKVVFHGVKVEWRQRAIASVAGARFRLLCDYTAAIGFDFDQFGIRITADKPIKVRYRDVGIEIDSAESGFDAFGVVYENASFDIEDPGQWVINGPLGELIRVAGTRAGSGSTWVELDLKFALDLGVVKITGCTLRASFTNSGLGIEFRGFSAAVDLPGVISGNGSVSIGDGGLIRAGLAATIVPINTSASASLALQGDFVALEVGVILPVGIPLAQSGLAIYGFVGRVVSNGRRNMAGLPADPVGRELGWYERDGAQKYVPAPGQWAMGLGISIGTMPDTGFTFNALGMVSVGFPDPDVVISIDAKLFDRPSLPDEKKPPSPAGSLRILGVIAISPRAVVVGVRGSYVIPKVLRLELPFGAYFPLPGNPDPAFVRIGADGINGRAGDPVSLTLLPGTLDIGVWAYAMVEERNLIRLGDVAGFDLNGFSIGFGAGWSMRWGGGPIFLRASAKILAGLGTKPLTIVAGLFIEGELRIIIVSVSVRGNVKALITEQAQLFSGEFCGKVDFFFFSVEGCVDVEFGSGSDPGIPVPDHPLTRVDLTARTGAIVGRAYRAGEAPDTQRPALAWPDTVPLLNFAAYVQNRLAGSSFAPAPPELPGEPWSGTTELKYAYRLKTLAIRKRGGAAMAGPLESVWWWPTHRGGVLDPVDPPPSAHEGRQLALLSWHPTPWSRNIADGGKDTPANPGGTIGNLCTPIRERFRTCVRGDLLTRESLEAVRLSGPAGARFAAIVVEGFPGATSLADAAVAVSLAGWSLDAGQPRPFVPPINVPSGPAAVTAGYRLASIRHGAAFVVTLGARIEPTLAIDDAVLTLELCVGARQPGIGGCDDFSEVAIGQPVTDGMLRRPGVTYEWLAPFWQQASPIVDHFAPDRDGKAELWVGSKGVVATLDAPTDRVELTVAHAFGSPISAVARDASGAIVARAQATDVLRQPQQLVLAAAGIVAVQVSGGGDGRKISIEGGGSLLKFCAGHGGGEAEDMLRGLIGAGGDSPLPRVQARMPDGSMVTLAPRGVGSGNVDVGPATFRRAAVRRCALVQYTVPAGRTATELVISPWTGGAVTIVALCGTDWITRYIQTINGEAQTGTAGSLTAHSDPATSSERPNLLDADTDYEIVVGVEWAGWRKPRGAPANAGPPPISDALAWSAFGDVVHAFRTAPAAVLPANPPPADFKDERTFDPRGLMRYFLGFRPDGLGAPHFLGDVIKVDFRADHIAPLLAKYGRSLELKLRRTDPPPSSLAGPGGLGGSLPPPLVPITITVGLLDKFLLEPSDLLLVNAAEDAPCLEAPAVGGRTLDIAAPLEPDADYDLLLVAPPVATPASDSVLISRGHFHTSRYAGPAALLAAMALPVDGNPDPRLPTDALVLPGLPAPMATPNDADFETVLRALGLDPWPLPTLPRVVALWSRTAPFRLHGIMLETDEPLERPGRMAIASIAVAGTVLQKTAANTATTRMIWMAAAPLLLAGDAVISVAVLDRGVTITGQRSILRVPRMALLEGLA